MAFDNLQEKLVKTFRNLQGKGKLSERNMEETLQEIRVALLESDVNYQVTKDFLEHIKEESLGKDVLNAVEPGELLVKIVHDEIVKLLGDGETELNFSNSGLTKIMVVGLQGTGKTTHVAKIANQLKKDGHNPLLIAADLIRPAAIEQLQTLGKQIDCEVYTEGIDKNVVKSVKNGLNYAKANNFDIVLIDTAGRLQIDEVLMNELVDIKKEVKPDEILLTVDALTGQDICNVAKTFNEVLGITGLIVTKFDGDSKGGGVLSVKAITNVPIKFTGVGEKVNDLEVFHPDRLAQRILGMGDVVSLVEKAQEEMDIKLAEESARRLLEGKFTLDDMMIQLEQSAKMGPLSKVMGMLPGMSEMAMTINDEDSAKQIKKTCAIIKSMTKYERAHPDELRGSHKRRIASGSGTSVDDVNRVINQYEKTSKVMKNMSQFKNMFKF